jgi:hypothetical protein
MTVASRLHEFMVSAANTARAIYYTYAALACIVLGHDEKAWGKYLRRCERCGHVWMED